MYKLGLLLIHCLSLCYPLSAILTHCQVHGGHLTPAQQLRAVLTPHLTPNYYQLDSSALQAAGLELPWVKSLKLQRRLTSPFTLHIIIQEHTPLSLWRAATLPNRQWILSTDGQLLALPVNDPYLLSWQRVYRPPTLQGILPQILRIYAAYYQQLQGTSLKLEELDCAKPSHCRVKLGGGYTLHLNPEKNRKALEVFVRIVPHLSAIPPIHIDLRYPHGIAVSLP